MKKVKTSKNKVNKSKNIDIQKKSNKKINRLILYNIEYCEGMTGRWIDYLKIWKSIFPPKNLDIAIINTLKSFNPDILALVEFDKGSYRSEHKNELSFFEKKLNMSNSACKTKYENTGIGKIFCHLPILKEQTNAIISKKELSDVKYHYLDRGIKRLVIEASLNTPKRITLLLAHLALTKKARKQQIKQLITIVNNIKNPVILMGDFNTFHGEEEIKELVNKTLLEHKFMMHKNELKFTHPTINPKRILDYVLTSKQIEVEDYKVLRFPFSDHLPILVDFKIK